MGVVLAGLGVSYAGARLDDADKWGSVVSALAAVLGLAMSAYGIVLARRAAGQQAVTGQTVDGSVVGGGVTQIRGVRGNVRVGLPSASPVAEQLGRDVSEPPGVGGQRVGGTWVGGPVRQVDDVDGDAEIDR